MRRGLASIKEFILHREAAECLAVEGNGLIFQKGSSGCGQHMGSGIMCRKRSGLHQSSKATVGMGLTTWTLRGEAMIQGSASELPYANTHAAVPEDSIELYYGLQTG